MASDASVESVLARVVRALDASGVPYMLTGSFASTVHGAPRTTQDINIVIAPTLGTLENLLRQFPDDAYYVSRDAALQAYGADGLFNVIDFASGWKVDFILRKSRAFSIAEFERRESRELLGSALFIASAEDVVLSKLEWSKLSNSERQLHDVAGILQRQLSLDTAYVEQWVPVLGVASQWLAARRLAEAAP